MPEFLRNAIQEIASTDSSIIPSVSPGKETKTFQDLSATLSGKTSLGEQLQQKFSALNQKMTAYSQSPLPSGAVSQPAPTEANENSSSNRRSLSR